MYTFAFGNFQCTSSFFWGGEAVRKPYSPISRQQASCIHSMVYILESE